MIADLDNFSDTELLATIRRCSACPDLPFGPRPILQWHPAARILIAGQAPGSLTHNRGIPFDDPSGERLRDWLGVDRPTFYRPDLFAIVPMAFCFPGTGKGGDLQPPPRCAELWRKALLDRMRSVDLTIILGHHARSWHLGGKHQTMTEAASRWRETLPRSVILPHPSPRNRGWLARNSWFESELLGQLRTRIQQIIASA